MKTSGLVRWKPVALLILFFFIGHWSARAQSACNNPVAKGGFTLSKTTVCVNTPVNVVTVAANVVNEQYNFSYDGMSSIDKVVLKPDKSFSYSKPGTYTVIQAGSGTGTGTIACQTVTVLPLDPIKFVVTTCSNRRALVVVDATTLGQYDTYEVNWGDRVVERKTRAEMLGQVAHTYGNATNSTYTVTVQGIYNAPANCNSPITSSSPVTVTSASLQPTITALTTTSTSSIELKYQTAPTASVQLYQKINGAYVATGQKGTGPGTFTVQTDANQVQCFQILSQDGCNSLKSDEVCSLVLDVKAENKKNNLSWQPYAGTISAASPFRYYRILRNGAPTGGTQTNRNTGTYPDVSAIACGTQYCYSIEATISGTAQTVVTSAPVCVMGINGDVPAGSANILVTIENNRPRIVATQPNVGTSFTLIVSRASGPSGFQQIATVDGKSQFIDETADPSAGSYCYQVAYLNNCGLTSVPSEPVCTVFLGSQSSTGIDWTAESPFVPGSVNNYIVEVIDSVNGTKREIPVSANTHYEPDPNDPNLQSQKYRIIAIGTDGNLSFSNFFTFRREARILVPDAFTPNGDGINDELLARGIYVDQFTMHVYNRWGEVVYSTTDKTKGWDGLVNGQEAATGQYLYRIEVIDLTGLKTVRTGAVLLIR
ncbi:hypothetical protein GCM10027190_58140 [Spirosoma areae]